MPMTHAQRMDQFEGEITAMKDTIPGQISSLKESLENQISQMYLTMDKAVARLTESQLKFQEEQTKFREEMRTSWNSRGSPAAEVRQPTSNPSLGRPPSEVGGNGVRDALSGFSTTFRDANSGGRSGEGGNWKYRRLEFPTFSGENPDGWITRAEMYFAFHELSEAEQLAAAVVGLDGDALL